MNDFNKIKIRCEEVSELTSDLIDEFLLHYAVAKDKLSQEFDLRIAAYKHITQKETTWVNMLKSQYIIHRVFKAGGLLRKYLNHVEIKRRNSDELEFLAGQLLVPWRFSFSVIVGNPAPDFYEMQDVFSGFSFLLYSKSVTETLKEQPALLWFNLIAFNGSCWQTFGPLNAYQSFDADDIFFYATEFNPRIDNEESLILDVEKNPVPYMMLLNGARMPVVVNKNDELLFNFSELELASIDIKKLKEHFKVEYNSDTCRITLRKFDEPPHLAGCYFDEKENLLIVTAMTSRGFNALVQALNKNGFTIDEDPQIRIHPSMLVTTESILKKKLNLNPYEKLYFPEPLPEQKLELDKINQFLQSAMYAINEGKVADIEALARKAGIDLKMAKTLVEDMVAKFESMKKPTSK